ncbi:hypothetical protein P781_16805 [Vibrio mimicus CAIM 1883]|nr:hypothetical protein P780_16840 [Vibrio mimicus CAIM 1882]ERM53483.1 hypothetical protein P781_16805 [Vibrio mimicus CAIM 1883]
MGICVLNLFLFNQLLKLSHCFVLRLKHGNLII